MKPTTAVTAIPFKRESDVGTDAIGNGAIGVLAVSIVAIGLVLWARKRLKFAPAKGQTADHVQVLETLRLGPQAVLSVVEFGGSRHLIVQSPQGVTSLASVPLKADS